MVVLFIAIMNLNSGNLGTATNTIPLSTCKRTRARRLLATVKVTPLLWIGMVVPLLSFHGSHILLAAVRRVVTKSFWPLNLSVMVHHVSYLTSYGHMIANDFLKASSPPSTVLLSFAQLLSPSSTSFTTCIVDPSR